MSRAARAVSSATVTQPATAIDFKYDGASRMTAGALQRWVLQFTPHVELLPGACIGVAHRWPSDWGIAQASDPAGADYLEAKTSNGASVRWWNARLHSWHPFDHIVFAELPEGLAANESVALHYGGSHHGSPGFRVQTFIEEASPFSLRLQAGEDGPWVEFARHTVEVVGAEPARLVVSAPSRVRAGAPFEAHVRIEDKWGNPARVDAPFEVELVDDEPGAIARARTTMPSCAWTRLAFSLEATRITA